jgi:hypothetical protein
MLLDETLLREILGVAHAVCGQGEGLSIREAMARTKYAELREQFSARDLVSLIRDAPKLAEDWFGFSCDKRCSGGWYLTDDYKCILRSTPQEESYSFVTVEEGIANYVVRELDFWNEVQQQQ